VVPILNVILERELYNKSYLLCK